jgi:hypothetical protein
MLTRRLSNQVPRTRVDECSEAPIAANFLRTAPRLADLSVSTIMKLITREKRRDIAFLTNQSLLHIFITSDFVVQ